MCVVEFVYTFVSNNEMTRVQYNIRLSLLVVTTNSLKKNACDSYLLDFLVQLQSILDDEKKIDEYFHQSIFSDSQGINQISCNALSLMHVNILGGE